MTAAEVKGRDRHRQTMEALARANRTRLGQAELRREVKAGETTIAEALSDDRVARSTTLAYLLSWQFRWGMTRARKIIRRVGIPEGKPVHKLTDRQRDFVLEVLDREREPLTGVGSDL